MEKHRIIHWLAEPDRPSWPLLCNGKRAGSQDTLRTWKRHLRPVRAALLVGLSLIAALCVSLPRLRAEPQIASETVAAYLDGIRVSPLLFTVRSGLALIPLWLMMSLCGLCCFGGACAAALLVWAGLGAGLALGALITAHDPSFGGIPTRLILLFAARTLLLLGLYVRLAVISRATSDSLSDPATQLPPGARGLSPLMLRQLKASLSIGIAGLLIHTAYAAAVIGRALT